MTNHLTSALFTDHGAGWPEAGRPVRLLVDQALLDEDDGLVTLLAFESLGRARVGVGLALVAPSREAEGPDALADLAYLRTCASAIGASFVRPGAGAPAAVHRRAFAFPGRTLLAGQPGAGGAGAFAMLVVEAGATESAAVLAGEPLRTERPRVIGVRLRGALADGAGGAELVEAISRRLDGIARDAVVEYAGDGLAAVPMSERIAMASLGRARLGALASVFPSDERTRSYLAARGRESDWRRVEGGDEGFEFACEFDLSRVPAAERADVHARLGPLAEDADLRALAACARAGISLAGLDVVVSGRAARAALAAGGGEEALVRAGANVLDAGDARAQALLEPGAFAIGDDAEVAAGRARPVSAAALCAMLGGPAPALTGDEPAGAALPAGEVQGPAAVHDAGAIERAAAHVRPELGIPFTGSPRGVVLRVDAGDVAATDVLGQGPRAHAARGDAAALAALTSRRADADAAGPMRRERFAFLAATGRYGDGTGHDAAARATRALGVRAVFATEFSPAHARALAVHGVLPLLWRNADDARQVAVGEELELTGVGERLARGDAVAVRSLTRGRAFAARVALEPVWRDVVRAGGLLAMGAGAPLAAVEA